MSSNNPRDFRSFNETRNGAIDFFAMDRQSILDRAVIVPPVAAGAVQHFHETNPAFHHAPREQALTAKMLGSRIIQAV